MGLDETIKRNFTATSQEYLSFAHKKDGCRQCSLYEPYRHVGQSEGNASDPTFMVIGEALGAEEVSRGRPFIGPAGQKLRSELRKHPKVFNKQSTLISNVLCCRPESNRFPSGRSSDFQILGGPRTGKQVDGRELVNFCATNWVRKEIHIVQPKVIIVLGAQALDYIRGDRGITANRGAWKFLSEYRAWSFATFHPSYVLRSESHIEDMFEADIAKIAKTWEITVSNDPRMSKSIEELKEDRALDQLIENRFIDSEVEYLKDAIDLT
jgi:DNA polymerase